jgi:hypothetical protein
MIFSLIGRGWNLPSSVPEFIAQPPASGTLYVVGVYIVERFTAGPSALLVIVLGAIFFRLRLRLISGLLFRPTLSPDTSPGSSLSCTATNYLYFE